MAAGYANISERGYGSMVERQVANLKMGVRFSLPALTKAKTREFDEI